MHYWFSLFNNIAINASERRRKCKFERKIRVVYWHKKENREQRKSRDISYRNDLFEKSCAAGAAQDKFMQFNSIHIIFTRLVPINEVLTLTTIRNTKRL